MKISIALMATTFRGLKPRSPILVHYYSWASFTSTTPISLNHKEYILVEYFSFTFFHLIKGSRVCIQLLFTLPTFYVIFILFQLNTYLILAEFCVQFLLLSFSSNFMAFSMYLVRSQVKTQYFYSFIAH